MLLLALLLLLQLHDPHMIHTTIPPPKSLLKMKQDHSTDFSLL